MSAENLVMRETFSLTPAELVSEFERPELIRVYLKKARAGALDVGSLAYAERRFVHTNSMIAASLPIPVCLESLRPDRREIISEILNLIAMGNNDVSTAANLQKIRIALDWCDSNGHSNLFSSLENARTAYQSITDSLWHRLLVLKTCKVNYCYSVQLALQKLLTMKFKDDTIYITSGIAKFKMQHGSFGSVPSEERMRQQVRVALDLAKKLSVAIQDEIPYPILLEVAGSACNFLPSRSTPYLTTHNKRTLKVFNHETNSPRTATEISQALGLNKSQAKSRLDNFKKNLTRANDNPRSPSRLNLAMLASDAYAQLFLYITGATPSEFVKFEFENGMAVAEHTVTKQLKSIKLRAAGKITRYSISAKNGLSLLREYLKLRQWILNGQDTQYLFFSLNRTTNTPQQLSRNFQRIYFSKIHGTFLPDGVVNISPGISRKLKNIALHTLAENPEIIAKSLNHSMDTNLTHYSHQTIDRQRSELSTYWAAVHKAAELINSDGTGFSVPSGQCSDYQHPQANSEYAAIQPSCSNQLGCFYCNNYSCHADEEDTFKLLSALYVIDALKSASTSLKDNINRLQNISDRICELIEAISLVSSKHKSMVERIQYKVFSLGHLTPFWESRMVRFESVGLVI